MPEGLRVKICGLTRREDAETAQTDGADYLGVVLSPGFARSIEVGEACRILDGLAATRVAVLVDEPAERAASLARALSAGVVQLHGAEPRDAVHTLRQFGDWRIWKAVRAAAPDDVGAAVALYGDLVDGILVEGWKAGVTGGGGARIDPGRFPSLREWVPPNLELVLAGGLTAENVAAAVDRYRPDVVDVSSGVESMPGAKDPALLRRFIQQARAARGGHPDPPFRRGDHS